MQYRINDAEPIKRPYRGFNLLTPRFALGPYSRTFFGELGAILGRFCIQSRPRQTQNRFKSLFTNGTVKLGRKVNTVSFCPPSSLRKTLKGFKIALTENRLRRETEFSQRSKAALLFCPLKRSSLKKFCRRTN